MLEKAYQVLQNVFGYEDFRLEQKNAIQAALNKEDAFVLMPTGGGKSLCYQVPALCFDGLTVVISPLISLMKNQVDALKINGVAAEFLNSTLDMDIWNEIYQDVISGDVKLLYLSPEGLASTKIRNLLKNANISFIAVDEAHCVSQWGHEFRSDYKNLGSLRELLPHVPMMALTATADQKVRDDIIANLHLKEVREFVSSFDRANIRYEIRPKDNGTKQLLEFLKEHEGETGIIYCGTRKKVDQITEKLRDQGLNAYAYHAGLSDVERSLSQEKFEKEEDIIIVATIAFGMGIDKPNVRFVAHLGLSKNIESYYQETGRAGRDGEPAVAWMVYGLDDLVRNKNFLNNSDASGVYKELATTKIDSMLSFCELTTCRRKYLLSYFGEEYPRDCGNCDCCLNEFESHDATLEAKKFLSAVFRTGQNFGAKYIIDILRGAKEEKILNRSHHELSVYGIGRETPAKEWNYIVRNLVFREYLFYKNLEYRTLALAPKALEILKEGKTFSVNRPLKKLGTGLKTGLSKKREKLEISDVLLEKLKARRSALAKKLRVPPYQVFSNRTLEDMAERLPRTQEEFLEVHGVGQKKCQKFADDFLSIIIEDKQS
ncbi:DNA helicase RecQ [Bacteriovorax sp. DB6_IX]|uniref:DNA helicase RecQ n=1 Tax=Bacteriovorax sp. DB6_IX TaxID=1353530 RepID=UPI000389EE67|nr:DNA helicase RecQ [Bacteriovorax sp. DB6_IX]EQC50489.1 ATP-dependent DNA helicase RecQ [Bacteriovorax sp. DB6_IX]